MDIMPITPCPATCTPAGRILASADTHEGWVVLTAKFDGPGEQEEKPFTFKLDPLEAVALAASISAQARDVFRSLYRPMERPAMPLSDEPWDGVERRGLEEARLVIVDRRRAAATL